MRVRVAGRSAFRFVIVLVLCSAVVGLKIVGCPLIHENVSGFWAWGFRGLASLGVLVFGGLRG